MTETRGEHDQNLDRRLGSTVDTEPRNAANLLQTQKWNPMWLWAVFGVIVVSSLIIGLLFGGDGGYS